MPLYEASIERFIRPFMATFDGFRLDRGLRPTLLCIEVSKLETVHDFRRYSGQTREHQSESILIHEVCQQTSDQQGSGSMALVLLSALCGRG